uniref:Uncharacterized protein n=1 Tax=Anguilla anguilla TaxID=7936 RepID=A0A0E9X0H0_ANGAN
MASTVLQSGKQPYKFHSLKLKTLHKIRATLFGYTGHQ